MPAFAELAKIGQKLIGYIASRFTPGPKLEGGAAPAVAVAGSNIGSKTIFSPKVSKNIFRDTSVNS